MKTFIKIHTGRDEVGDVLFERLCKIYPPGQKRNGFSIEGDSTSEDSQAVLACLSLEGWKPINPLAYVPRSFWMGVTHVFDDHDLAQAQYLVLTPEIYCDGGRTKEGMVILVSNPSGADNALPPGEEFVSAGGAGIAVSERVRRLMEIGAFGHVVFKELLLTETFGPDPRIVKPFWQMTSDFIMPSLSPQKCVLLDESNKPYDGDPAKPYYLWGGVEVPDVLVKPVDIYYKASDIAALEPFDLALTRERIGGYGLPLHIISQRFYQFCVSKGLKVNCRPVFIDSD
ncbi:MAG: hypothetical protein ABIY70_10300 [Capsulimonas sp.]|uniref:hypothetical protein n=1 Tax=Capsulimonas sp. TaxID=2494211 RepID=UPI003264A17E